jgi:hypothetical protein
MSSRNLFTWNHVRFMYNLPCMSSLMSDTGEYITGIIGIIFTTIIIDCAVRMKAALFGEAAFRFCAKSVMHWLVWLNNTIAIERLKSV